MKNFEAKITQWKIRLNDRQHIMDLINNLNYQSIFWYELWDYSDVLDRKSFSAIDSFYFQLLKEIRGKTNYYYS